MVHLASRTRSLPQVFANVLLLLLALATALLMLEGALRLLGMLDPVLYRSDPVIGYELQPNQSARRLGVPIRINDLGLRDDEDRSSLLRSTARILVIGNSVTFGGSRTRQRDLFTEVLERELLARRLDVKVLNAGVNGYSVSQMVARARTLLSATEPTTLVLVALRDDFFRPPVQFIRKGNFAYPLHRPASALADFLRLALGYLDRRHQVLRHLPKGLRQQVTPTPVYVPPYDTTNIVGTHIAAFDKFLCDEWERRGGSRDDVIVFFSPTRSDLLENRREPNADLVQGFAAIQVRAYDLQHAYREAIIAQGQKVTDYYHDAVHYLEPGHALAGRTIAAVLLREGIPGKP